jgi:hypothetical protein
LPWAKGALPDTESGLGWGVNWVVRSPEVMGGKETDGGAAGQGTGRSEQTFGMVEEPRVSRLAV